MKFTTVALALAGSLLVSSSAFAQMTTDDLKWVNQCLRDNQGAAGATPEVIRKYCVCMNNKMDDNETRSISVWEKANPVARAACDKESGWK